MKLLILGATGQTGAELVRQGIARGFDVTALVRSPQKITIAADRLEVVAGSPLDKEVLTRVLAGKDAVLSALGHTDLKESYLVTEAAAALLKAMHASAASRLVIVSSTLVAPGGSFLTRIPRYLTRHALNDSARMEKVIEPSEFAWTILRLVRLTNKPETPYRLFADEPPSVSASISRKTVAACMLDLVSDGSSLRKTLGVRQDSAR
jgi:putative NADH-flavin reductase